MNVIEIFERIALRFPESDPKITELSTGVAMLDFSVNHVRYCAETFPSHNAFGLSKIEGSSPFYEGVDESFSSVEKLEARIITMMEKGRVKGSTYR